MKRVVVTGGAGFIGSHLVDRLLAEGHQVIVVDNFYTGSRTNLHPAVEVIRHDITAPVIIECDWIFHLACPAAPKHYQRYPARTITTAFLGTLNVLNWARDVWARVLVASTSEVYGQPLEHPQRETLWSHVNTWGPRACYDVGKCAGETLAHAYRANFGVDARVVRIHNTYGPRMAVGDGRVVPNMIVQALRGEALEVHGDGSQTRSFSYVSDMVDGCMRAMTASAPPDGPVNLGTPGEIAIVDLAREILGLTGRASDAIRFGPLPIDDPIRRCPDISKARDWLHWEPRVTLRDGLKLTIEWFRSGAGNA